MTTNADTPASGRLPIFHRPIVHIGYVVKDIQEAAARWTRTFGAGPFLLLEHIAFDEIEHEGGPVVFDHSAAFGRWGDITVELQQIFTLEPAATLGAKLAHPSDRPNHVAYLVEDPGQESARLERLGASKLLRATTGPVEITFHDVPWLGHTIEIHKDSEFIRAFFADIAAAARGWDGADPLRVATSP